MKKRDPRIVKSQPFCDSDDQWCCDRGKHWRVPSLIRLARDLPVQEVPLSAINMDDRYNNLTLREFVGHMESVLKADLRHPVILSADGWLMDGRHRVMKSVLEGRPTIKIVRFQETPPPDREDT